MLLVNTEILNAAEIDVQSPCLLQLLMGAEPAASKGG